MCLELIEYITLDAYIEGSPVRSTSTTNCSMNL